MPIINSKISANVSSFNISIEEIDGWPTAKINNFDSEPRTIEELKNISVAFEKASMLLKEAESFAISFSTFQRGDNLANERCLTCKKHVSRHYGIGENRCFPKKDN